MEWNRYIKENCHRNLRLDDIAAEFQVSPDTLRSRIRRETGVSFKRQYLQAKLEKAVRLMRTNPEIRIVSVAEYVGIDDPFYFSRLFHKYMGQCPSDFRDNPGD